MAKFPEIGTGKLRNKVCPFCESGVKFKKCSCLQAQQELVGAFTPRLSELEEQLKMLKQLEAVEKAERHMEKLEEENAQNNSKNS